METHDALARQEARSTKGEVVDLVPGKVAGTPHVEHTDPRVVGAHIGVSAAEARAARTVPSGTKITRKTRPPGPIRAGSAIAPSDASPATSWIRDALLRRYTCPRSATLPACPARWRPTTRFAG